MGNSLLDQLKKTGLVDKTKVQKVKHGKYKSKKQKAKKGADEQLDEAKRLSQKAHADKVERDREINRQNTEEAERKAIVAQIIQLIETNRVEDRDGDVVYNFTDSNVVKRIFVSEMIHKHLSSGYLFIAKLADSYELVPSVVAEKIKQRDASCIIGAERPIEVDSNEDDPYADYTIPDDLIW